MDSSRDAARQVGIYSLRERIEDIRSHAPSTCTGRPGRGLSRRTTLCRFERLGSRSLKPARLVV
jgi:hypothetical protein